MTPARDSWPISLSHFCGVVVQVLSEPALDLGHSHSLAFAIVSDLVAVNFAQTEISRLRVCEVKSTYAGAGPHGKGFGNQHSGIRLHVEQTPQGALLGVIWTLRVTS